MEFPDLGKHCTFDGCAQLDFLPYTCYHCKKIFCQEHFKLDDHRCPGLNDPSLDVRVSVCPICEQPVPGPRDEDPNIRVNRHIQNNCPKPNKPSNTCRLRGCQAKLLVPMECSDCRQAFCVKHRLPIDHQCQGPPTKNQNRRPVASTSSSSQSKTLSNFAQSMKKGLHVAGKSGSDNERQRIERAEKADRRRQEMARLQEKAKRGCLTEEEQVRLSTLMSLEDKQDKNNCIVS